MYIQNQYALLEHWGTEEILKCSKEKLLVLFKKKMIKIVNRNSANFGGKVL